MQESMHDPDGMIRKARIKARGMQGMVKEANWDSIIKDAYNVMFMAARGALTKMGHTVTTHQTVASNYRRELIDKGVIDQKYANHLSKIKKYWENEMEGHPEEIDGPRAEKIVEATLDLVDALAHLGEPKKSKIKTVFYVK